MLQLKTKLKNSSKFFSSIYTQENMLSTTLEEFNHVIKIIATSMNDVNKFHELK